MRYLLMIPIFLTMVTSLFSADFGKQGSSYPIEEIDPRLQIENHNKFEKSFSEEGKKAVEDYLDNPEPVPGLQKATVACCWEFDPTMELKEDILDGSGKVLFEKGKRVNPLDYQGLEESFFFFDGSDESQLDLAREYPDCVWVLVNGSPKKLQSQENKQVFFDQYGVFSHHLGLRNIPAKVSQLGKKLIVEEIPTN